MSPRPRLLFLCHTFPYPPDGGVWLRTFNILRLLADQFEITLLCFERGGGAMKAVDAQASLAVLGRYAETSWFEIPQLHSSARLLWDHLRSVARGRPFTWYLYQSRKFKEALLRVLASQHFDLVHVDSLDLVGYLPYLDGLPVVCQHHNVESRLLERRAFAEGTAARRAYVRLQARLTAKMERVWCPRVSLNVAVSEGDAQQFQAIAEKGRYWVVPNGVDTEYFTPGPELGTGIVSVGGSQWFPNRDALRYFCDDILPLVRNGAQAVTVSWVGATKPGDAAEFGDGHGIRLPGLVPDVRPYVRGARCLVVPLRVGGGSRLKILDGWAMGKPIVATSIGSEGLDARDGDNILIADTPEAFATAVHRVLTDDALARRLGRSGRETAESRYSWQVIGRGLASAYREVQESARRSGKSSA